jgi:hypothetical protein
MIYDIPPLIKSIRNNLLSGDFLFVDKCVFIKVLKKPMELTVKSHQQEL